jgi:hypothetical protein
MELASARQPPALAATSPLFHDRSPTVALAHTHDFARTYYKLQVITAYYHTRTRAHTHTHTHTYIHAHTHTTTTIPLQWPAPSRQLAKQLAAKFLARTWPARLHAKLPLHLKLQGNVDTSLAVCYHSQLSHGVSNNT